MSFLWRGRSQKADESAAAAKARDSSSPTEFSLDDLDTVFDDDRNAQNQVPDFLSSSSTSAADLYSSAPTFTSSFPTSTDDADDDYKPPALSGPLFDPASSYGSLSTPRAGRSRSLDYLFAEDFDDFRKKSAGEQLVYLCGVSYLSGAAVGGSWGLVEGLRGSAGKARKLRLNAVLNAMGKRGPLLANSLGVLALMFSGLESLLYHYTRDDTLVNYVAAGAGAGALFKSTQGMRAAGRWGVGIACVTTGLVYGSRQGYLGRGLRGVL